ncbi:MerR family transcriptional regulator [Planosporangium thailandense]|uniref:MerR family transcriptional regulator n=1 Tax=Planosporangium thailandense TaxID=765197 RepID=A0ABX0XSP2_9ACTN|nr:MerR family transcriptional regulator [Planosporangium thailandense]
MTDELLSAGAAARRLGVAVTTLRSWHQRYGLGPSCHRRGQHRRYTDDDMARLALMQHLVTAGVPPAEAARWARRSPSPDPATPVSSTPSRIRHDGGGPDGAGPDSTGPDSTGPDGTGPDGGGRDGGGRALALGDAEPAARGLGRAAMRLDGLDVHDLVAAAVAERGVVDAWDRILCPVLVAVGERAAHADELVEVEHLLSGCISAVFASLPRPPRDHPVRVLLTCADEEQHSLPIEALAAALAVHGVPARVLGARVPPNALRAAVHRTGPVAVLVWAHARATADPAQLDDLVSGRGRPAVVAAGGPGWEPASLPAGVVVPATLADAVELFAVAAD